MCWWHCMWFLTETLPQNIWLLNGCVDVAIFNHFQIGASSIICEEEVEFGWREVEESVSKSLKTVSSADNPVGLKSWCASLYDTEVWEYHMVKLTLFDCHIFLFLLARQAQLRSMLSSSLEDFLFVLIRWVLESGGYPRQLQGFPTPGLANYQATGGPLVLLWSAREHQLRYSQNFRQSLVNLLEGYVSKRLLKLLNKTDYWLYSFVNW